MARVQWGRSDLRPGHQQPRATRHDAVLGLAAGGPALQRRIGHRRAAAERRGQRDRPPSFGSPASSTG